MKASNTFFIAALSFVFAVFAPSTLRADARELIEITGRILLDGETAADAVLIIEVNDLDCIPFDLEADGRFTLSLPVNSKANIRFEKPGYLSKEVTVDTRHALLTKDAVKENKLVRFDVQMQPEPDALRMYAGPVGTISFVKGSGLMKVRYDRTLINTPAPIELAREEE